MQDDFKIHKPTPDPIPPTSYSDQPIEPESPKKKKLLASYKGFLSVVQLFAGALLLAFFINQFIFQSYEVFGQSMSPNLHEGDRLIISKLSKSWNKVFRGDYLPSRGEIVVFRNPRDSTTQLVKRIVGLPGEHVVVNDGQITVFNDEFPDGFNPDKEYELDKFDTQGNIDLTVPENEVFVVGDNRSPNGSYDSRSDLGTIPLDKIVGELVLRVFPLDDARFY